MRKIWKKKVRHRAEPKEFQKKMKNRRVARQEHATQGRKITKIYEKIIK